MRKLIALLAASTLAAACASAPAPAPTTEPPSPTTVPSPTTTPSEEPEEDLLVVVTTSILGDIVANLVGDDATVEVLMGPGVDPHDFAPSAAQAALLREADLVIANGLDLELGMVAVLEAAAAEGANVVELADRLDPLPFALASSHSHDHDDHSHDHEGDDHSHDHEGDDHSHDHEGDDHSHDHKGDDHSHDHDHHHGDEDPHFWLDPLRMADAVDLIAAALAEVRPDGRWTERAAALRAEIEALHTEIEAMLAAIPAERRKLVTNHDSLGYFAARYGFEVIATVIPGGTTLAEPSAAELGRLVTLLREEGIRAVFSETTASPALAEAVAAELGEEVAVYRLYSDSLGEPGSGADTYLGMMRANAAIIAEALG